MEVEGRIVRRIRTDATCITVSVGVYEGVRKVQSVIGGCIPTLFKSGPPRDSTVVCMVSSKASVCPVDTDVCSKIHDLNRVSTRDAILKRHTIGVTPVRGMTYGG